MKKINKKKIIVFVLFIILIILIFFNFFVSKYREKLRIEKVKEEARQKEELRLKTFEENYNTYVKVNKDAFLYKKTDKYNKIGSVTKGTELSLSEINPKTYKDDYIKLNNLDYYINYKDISKSEYKEIKWNDRYKKYIPFNQNIILSDNYTLYENENTSYSLTEEISLPIIINDTDRYYVEYDKKLMYVFKNDSIKVIDNVNSNEESTDHFAIINYHFIIDPATDTDCTGGLCMSKEEFDSHMKLLYDLNYFTVNTKELEWFIDSKIRLPKKSVMVTEDDGWYAYNTSAILEKYNLNGVLFLITSTYSNIKEFETPYLEVHSHGHDLHVNGECPGGSRGARILCLDHDKLINDLKTSRSLLNNSTAFCYPFYEYNNYAIEALKEAGFTLAFAGGGRDVYVGDNKYIVPRYGINSGISLNNLERIITVN